MLMAVLVSQQEFSTPVLLILQQLLMVVIKLEKYSYWSHEPRKGKERSLTPHLE